MRKSIASAKHPWVREKLTTIFELSLDLVEEYEGQAFVVYHSDEFARKSLPVLEAMCNQKTGKKLFIGIVSNALVGITNTMSFYWWTPTRLMSKNDLQYMAQHVVQLKNRLAKSHVDAVPAIMSDKAIGTNDIDDDTDNSVVVIEELPVDTMEVNVDENDGFSSSDDDNFMQLAKTKSTSDTIDIAPAVAADDNGNEILNDFDATNITPAVMADGNGNELLPKPKATTSTPKPPVAPLAMSQKAITKTHRRLMVENSREERKRSLNDSRMSWKSMLDSEEEEEAEISATLRLTLKLSPNHAEDSGGINYNSLLKCSL